MTSTIPIKHAQNPLRHLPSVMALPGLHPRLEHQLAAAPIGEKELVALLKLDPLAVIRGMRAMHSIVFPQTNAELTIPGIVTSLGPTLSKRLFDQPVAQINSTQSEEIKQLWQHSIATAHAAAALAKRTGMLGPEAAYLLGLLHDLPEWLRRLDRIGTQPEDANYQSANKLLHWQLPAPFLSLILAIEMGDRPASTDDTPDPPTLIRAAELLAELAGYSHPNGRDEERLATIRKNLGKSELVLAQHIHDLVDESLRSSGLHPDSPPAVVTPPNSQPVFGHAGGQIDKIIANILNCTQSKSYRDIITSVTAVAARQGNYDRAFFAKWINASSTLVIRSKEDSSSRRMAHTRLRVTDTEAISLREAIKSQTPQHLESEANKGLLHMLSTDELLAIPLNCDSETPAFLLLDRSLTLTPLGSDQDMTVAKMLGMTASLLIQNLLLRHSHHRAQKSALTDPLTRLFNRRMGIHALKQCISQTERDGRELTVLMCDLDHFKRLNDSLGHLCGDSALLAAADVLQRSVRKADTVCRYGGEEFLVVLPDTTPDDATVLAARMFTAVRARGEELGLPVTISIGLTSHRQGDTVESILNRADHALYASKDYGRNRFSADIEADTVISKDRQPSPTSGQAPQDPRER